MIYKNRFGVAAIASVCSAAFLIAIPGLAGAQGRSDQHRQDRGNQQGHSNSAPPAHAQREVVRSSTFVQRPQPTQFPVRYAPVQRYQAPQQITRPPVYTRPPIYSRPPVQAPVRQQPTYQPPARQQPIYRAPVQQRPVYQAPQPVYQAPVRQQPLYNRTPVRQRPTYQAPVRQQPPVIVSRPPTNVLRRQPTTSTYSPPAHRRRTAQTPETMRQKIFTQTSNGRVYDNGVRLRKARPVTSGWEKRYFHKGRYHFPYYRERFSRNVTFISPFGFYYGVCPPYISSAVCNYYPPAVEFVDVPVYNGNNCVGFEDTGEQNFLNDPNLEAEEPGLANAVDELRATFQDGNINALVTLIDPNTSIAIYERGQYKYSMSGDDYLDLTRDAIKSTPTVQFSIDYLHQTSPTSFTASGRHVYRDGYGNEQTMYVSFVLQDISGQWTLTQVETAPANYRDITP